MKHTPEPWRVHESTRTEHVNIRGVEPHDVSVQGFTIQAGPSGGITVTDLYPGHTTDRVERIARANAERIVACVNGCAGIVNPSAVGDAILALAALLRSEESPASETTRFLAREDARDALDRLEGR